MHMYSHYSVCLCKKFIIKKSAVYLITHHPIQQQVLDAPTGCSFLMARHILTLFVGKMLVPKRNMNYLTILNFIFIQVSVVKIVGAIFG